jgi:1,2-diacylglycerol 3-alpha-glucosyltransferase
MRIAIFSDIFYPELSGISDSILVLAKQLVLRGHFVDFYVTQYAEKNYLAANVIYKELYLGPKIQIHRFYSFPYTTDTGQGRFVVPTGLRAMTVAHNVPDIIHTQMFFGVGLEAVFASRVLRKPLIGTQHTAVKEFLKYSPVKSSLTDKLILNYVNWFYERGDLTTAPSQSVFNEMESIGFKPRRAQVISNPIDINTFRPLAKKAALKKKFGLGNKTFIYAGRLSDDKHPEILVKVLAMIKKTIPDAMLAFAGKGAAEESLKKLARDLGVTDSVKFLGFVDKPTLCEIYNACEVFGIASTSDTQSLVMMQAMAAGIPVVGVNARALPEYINANNGLVVEPSDEHAFAEKVIYLLKNPKVAEKLGEGGRTYAEQFGEAAIAEKWEAIYEKTIKDYNSSTRKL